MPQIRKASGEIAEFKEEKLRNSLVKSGASDYMTNKIIEEVKSTLYEGITTKEIYKKAFALLQTDSGPSAARYKLKNAIMELGPTGYPFEKFVGEILKYQGFNVQVGTIVQGNCVQHEVDVIADKGKHRYMVECKFHNDHSKNCDVKIPLYIQSRFKDIELEWKKNPKHNTKFHQGWIFTNTRFSDDAIQYGKCVGLVLVGWNYPRNGNLKERIDMAGLHPVTCLTTITQEEKQQILEKQKVLCKEILQRPQILKDIGVSKKRHPRVMKEVEEICNI